MERSTEHDPRCENARGFNDLCLPCYTGYEEWEERDERDY